MGMHCQQECTNYMDLANEETGEAEANDIVNWNEGEEVRYRYQVAVMPDGVTTIRPKWYKAAIVDGEIKRNVKEPFGKKLNREDPHFVLKEGTIHHRTILAFMEIQEVAGEEARASGSRLLVEDV